MRPRRHDKMKIRPGFENPQPGLTGIRISLWRIRR
jgi:hypothetical protein